MLFDATLLNDTTNKFFGFELATFRLKENVTQTDLIELSKKVDAGFLSDEKELIAHFLLKGKDGVYADVALATTQEKAEEICQLWLTNKVALEYLDLIDQDSVDMSFWTRIS